MASDLYFWTMVSFGVLLLIGTLVAAYQYFMCWRSNVLIGAMYLCVGWMLLAVFLFAGLITQR